MSGLLGTRCWERAVRYLIQALATMLALISSSAFAQDASVSLRPGEQAVVLLDGDDRTHVTVVALSQEEQVASIAWLLQRQDAVETTVVPAIVPEALRITFLNLSSFFGRDEHLLLIENGYDRALRYRAVIFQGEESDPTSVCTVFPMLRGVEHWPHPIDRIDLSRLSLEPVSEGDSIVCE